MTKNEIKKALYKEKPDAVKGVMGVDGDGVTKAYSYISKLKDGTKLTFIIPAEEHDEDKFENPMPAQLLIRWLVTGDHEEKVGGAVVD